MSKYWDQPLLSLLNTYANTFYSICPLGQQTFVEVPRDDAPIHEFAPLPISFLKNFISNIDKRSELFGSMRKVEEENRTCNISNYSGLCDQEKNLKLKKFEEVSLTCS